MKETNLGYFAQCISVVDWPLLVIVNQSLNAIENVQSSSEVHAMCLDSGKPKSSKSRNVEIFTRLVC